jgi:hypothetical protein
MLRAAFCLAVAAGCLGGCALITVPVAVAGAGDGINYTSGTSDRAFTNSKAQVRAAVLQALDRMDISVLRDEKKGDAIKVVGKTKTLKITITLTSITPTLTKASIEAERNWLMKDQTVAAEILIQAGLFLKRGGG